MGAINHPARQPAPSAAVSRVLSRFTRAELEGFVAVAIDLMDVADGDPDLEIGDDLEDDFLLSPYALAYSEGRGPGCEISDAGGGNVDDQGEGIDEREPDNNEDHCQHYGVDQDAPVGDRNPVIC